MDLVHMGTHRHAYTDHPRRLAGCWGGRQYHRPHRRRPGQRRRPVLDWFNDFGGAPRSTTGRQWVYYLKFPGAHILGQNSGGNSVWW